MSLIHGVTGTIHLGDTHVATIKRWYFDDSKPDAGGKILPSPQMSGSLSGTFEVDDLAFNAFRTIRRLPGNRLKLYGMGFDPVFEFSSRELRDEAWTHIKSIMPVAMYVDGYTMRIVSWEAYAARAKSADRRTV